MPKLSTFSTRILCLVSSGIHVSYRLLAIGTLDMQCINEEQDMHAYLAAMTDLVALVRHLFCCLNM